MIPTNAASSGKVKIAHTDKDKDAQLCGGTQQQTLGVCDQRTKVGHGTNANKNQAGINAQFYTEIDKISIKTRITSWQLSPVHMAAGKKVVTDIPAPGRLVNSMPNAIGKSSNGSKPFLIAKYSKTQAIAIIIRTLGSDPRR